MNILSTTRSVVIFATLGLVPASCAAWVSAWLTDFDTYNGRATKTIHGTHSEYGANYYRIRLETIGKTRYITGVYGEGALFGYIYNQFPTLRSQWDFDPHVTGHLDIPAHPQLRSFGSRYNYLNSWFEGCCLSKAALNESNPEEFSELRKYIGYDENAKAFWMTRIDDRCGWPFRSFRALTRLAPLAKARPYYDQEVKWGIPEKKPKEVWNLYPPPGHYLLIERWNEWKVLPLRPIWTGLLLNALFWGTILAGIRYGFCFGRRALRRRRGLCPECAYIIHGTENKYCPECGTTL